MARETNPFVWYKLWPRLIKYRLWRMLRLKVYVVRMSEGSLGGIHYALKGAIQELADLPPQYFEPHASFKPPSEWWIDVKIGDGAGKTVKRLYSVNPHRK